MGRRILAADRLSDVRQVDEHSTALANGYRDSVLVGVGEIYPIATVVKESGKYTNWGATPHIPIAKFRGAIGSKRLRIDVANSGGSFNLAQYEVEVPIYDRVLRETHDDDRDTLVESLTLRGERVIQLGMEVEISSFLQNSANYDAAMVEVLAGVNQWQDQTNSNPLNDLRRWVRKVRLALNVPQEMLHVAIGIKTYEALTDHPKVLNRAVGTTGEDPDEARIAKLLRVGKVRILSGSYAVTIDESIPDSMVAADLWGDVVLVYLPVPKPRPDLPLAGAIVRKSGFPVVEEYIDPTVNGGPAIVKVTKENWGICQVSNKRIFLAKNVSGLV